MKYLYNLIFSLFLIILLGACGGGGTESTSSTGAIKNISPTAAILLNSGPIRGLRVTCGNQESTTAVDGMFDCVNFPVEVFLGNYKIGSINAIPTDKLVFTQDLLQLPRGDTLHPTVTKISMILQSFDEDATPLNGINMSPRRVELLNYHLSIDSNLEDFSLDQVNYIIADVLQSTYQEDENSLLVQVTETQAQTNLTIMTASGSI